MTRFVESSSLNRRITRNTPSKLTVTPLGRLSRDFGVILAPSTFGLSSTVFWELTVTDSSVNTTSTIMRASLAGDGPTQKTATQVLTGDFTGDGFADVLAFYANVPASNAPSQIYMTVVTAQDVNTLATGLRRGPAFATPNTWRVGSASVGDFNGDGRAEIAVLDSQGNLVICMVDPVSLQITPSNTLKLPVDLSNAITAAGHSEACPTMNSPSSGCNRSTVCRRRSSFRSRLPPARSLRRPSPG